MPKYWYDRAAIWKNDNFTDEEKEFQSRIVADKKPYFMRYIYPAVTKSWKKYEQNVQMKCGVLFNKKLQTLLESQDLTDEEAEFVENYYRYIPVGVGDCVMNKICWRFEAEFDGYMKKYNPGGEFDYTIMKSGASYTTQQKKAVKELFDKYLQHNQEYMIRATKEKITYEDKLETRRVIVDEFRRAAYGICSNRYQLCDIILDLTYTREGSKQFAWDVVPDVIGENLLNNSGGVVYIPERDADGDVCFNGNTYIFVPYNLEGGAECGQKISS